MGNQRIKALALVLLASGFVGLPMGCSTNPATGARQFMLLSRAQEEQIGAEAAPQFTEQYGGKVPQPRLLDYVTQIGAKMAKETEGYFPELNWEFTLLNSEVINAFALPGGKVFITRGLAAKLDNEAQMAGVLGHEIGHVTAQHGNQRISQQISFNIALVGLAVAVASSDEDSDFRKIGEYGVPALAIGGNLVLLKYGRDEELQADWLGMRYMSNVGYNPRGQLQVMQILGRESQGPRPPEFLSTHPHPESRVNRIRKLLDGDYRFTQGNENYQLFEARYKNQFLGPLAIVDFGEPMAALAALGPASQWCSHCSVD